MTLRLNRYVLWRSGSEQVEGCRRTGRSARRTPAAHRSPYLLTLDERPPADATTADASELLARVVEAVPMRNQAAYDPAYSLIEAEYDLGRLAAWNNLIAEQDRARARTVEAFKRRRLDPTGLRGRDAVHAKFERQYRALADWFQPGRGADVLRKTTANAIRQVARRTQRMVDRHRMGASRARDLERLATAFASCRTADDAHALAAVSLGCALSRHLRGSFDWHELTDGRPVWSQPAQEIALRKIYRGRRRSLGGTAPVRDSREAVAVRSTARIAVCTTL